jgi:hypothetical protein
MFNWQYDSGDNDLWVSNLRGEVIETEYVTLIAGLNELKINTEDLKSGIYNLGFGRFKKTKSNWSEIIFWKTF